MNANSVVRKMCSAAERRDGFEYSMKIIIVPLKERIAGTNVFLETNILLSVFHKNNVTRTKPLILTKKIKSKLRTKSGLLYHGT